MRFGLLIVLVLLLAIVLSACGEETLDPWDSKGELRTITDLSSGAKEDLIKVSTGILQVRTEATRDDCATGKLAASSPSVQAFIVADNGLGVRNDGGDLIPLLHLGDGLFCNQGPAIGQVQCISGFIAGGYTYTVFGPDKKPCYQAHHSLVLAEPASGGQESAGEAAPEPPAVALPETEAQEEGGEASETEGEGAAGSGSDQLPMTECVASPDMYTWTHTVTSKEKGSRGWKCEGNCS